MSQELLLGIDVGGTHTDAVAVERATGRVFRKLKVKTGLDLVKTAEEALGALLLDVDPERISRIALSTTLVTNSVVNNRLEPVGLILMAGPGMDPHDLTHDPFARIVSGSVDHRGRETAPLNRREVENAIQSFNMKGISVLAVAGKFSVRNPDHENTVASLSGSGFDHVALSHSLSGSLNFPRRAATAYLAAGVWRKHENFITSIKKSKDHLAPRTPLYLLRADGGAQRAESFKNAAEAALSGPAASVMGVVALTGDTAETVALDVGGTTTDISFYVNGTPLAEPQGATIGQYLTHIRSLYSRSLASGGDSEVRVEGGALLVGPARRGPAKALGGPAPTPTDAMISLGLVSGDRGMADEALTPLSAELGLALPAFCHAVLQKLSENIAEKVAELLVEINSRPVYTLHDLLSGHRVSPTKAILVGGPAQGLHPYLEKALGLEVSVPHHFEVANAVGAAVASLNLEVNATADTATGMMTIPEAEIYRKIDRSYTFENLKKEAETALSRLAAGMDGEMNGVVMDVAASESFNIIEDGSLKGSVHRLKLQVRPSILCKVDP